MVRQSQGANQAGGSDRRSGVDLLVRGCGWRRWGEEEREELESSWAWLGWAMPRRRVVYFGFSVTAINLDLGLAMTITTTRINKLMSGLSIMEADEFRPARSLHPPVN